MQTSAAAKHLKDLQAAKGRKWIGNYTKTGASGSSHTNIGSLSVSPTGALSGTGQGDGGEFQVIGTISQEGTITLDFKRKKDGVVTVSHTGKLTSGQAFSGTYKKSSPAEEGHFKFAMQEADDDDQDD